ncbi:MAG TPA: TetR/AcrR family transcriptional regulator [Solirubrobacteraceae bacterium]
MTARELFAKHGFQAVATQEIVSAAGTTRGALYHHFRDKEDLFCAVYEQIESELSAEIGQVVGSSVNSPWEALTRGGQLFLSACARAEVQRIVLIDAPSVLGWDRWREIGSRYGLGLIEGAVAAAIEAGEIEPRPVSAVAHMLLGAIDELALVLARADDRTAAQGEAQATFAWLLQSLRR